MKIKVLTFTGGKKAYVSGMSLQFNKKPSLTEEEFEVEDKEGDEFFDAPDDFIVEKKSEKFQIIKKPKKEDAKPK